MKSSERFGVGRPSRSRRPSAAYAAGLLVLALLTACSAAGEEAPDAVDVATDAGEGDAAVDVVDVDLTRQQARDGMLTDEDVERVWREQGLGEVQVEAVRRGPDTDPDVEPNLVLLGPSGGECPGLAAVQEALNQTVPVNSADQASYESAGGSAFLTQVVVVGDGEPVVDLDEVRQAFLDCPSWGDGSRRGAVTLRDGAFSDEVLAYDAVVVDERLALPSVLVQVGDVVTLVRAMSDLDRAEQVPLAALGDAAGRRLVASAQGRLPAPVASTSGTETDGGAPPPLFAEFDDLEVGGDGLLDDDAVRAVAAAAGTAPAFVDASVVLRPPVPYELFAAAHRDLAARGVLPAGLETAELYVRTPETHVETGFVPGEQTVDDAFERVREVLSRRGPRPDGPVPQVDAADLVAVVPGYRLTADQARDYLQGLLELDDDDRRLAAQVVAEVRVSRDYEGLVPVTYPGGTDRAGRDRGARDLGPARRRRLTSALVADPQREAVNVRDRPGT